MLARLAWGRIDAGRFAFIASGESMSRSKPQVGYYSELLDLLGLHPQECVMIGNDARNDSPASALGIRVYLLNAAHGSRFGLDADPALVTAGDWPALTAWLGVEEGACSSCVNPRSNGGAAAKRWPAVRSAMQLLRPDAQFVAPDSAAEAQSAIAAGIAAGHDAIVVAGGDGTVNLALNVIMDPATDRPRVAASRVGRHRPRQLQRLPQADRAASATSPGHPPGSTWPARRWWMSGRRRCSSPARASSSAISCSMPAWAWSPTATTPSTPAGGSSRGSSRATWTWPLRCAPCTAVAALRLPHVAVSSHGWDYDGPIANVGVLKSVYFAGGMRYDTAVVDDDGQFDVNIWRAAGRLAICPPGFRPVPGALPLLAVGRQPSRATLWICGRGRPAHLSWTARSSSPSPPGSTSSAPP